MQILTQTHTYLRAGLFGTGFALNILFTVTCKTGITSYHFSEKETLGSSGELDGFPRPQQVTEPGVT